MGAQRPFGLTAPPPFHIFGQAVSSVQQELGAAGARRWARLWDRVTGDSVPVLHKLSAICQMKTETERAQVTLLLSARASPGPLGPPDQASPDTTGLNKSPRRGPSS